MRMDSRYLALGCLDLVLEGVEQCLSKVGGRKSIGSRSRSIILHRTHLLPQNDEGCIIWHVWPEGNVGLNIFFDTMEPRRENDEQVPQSHMNQ